MEAVSLKEARERLGKLVRAAGRGEAVVITVHGKETACIGPIVKRPRKRLPDLTEFRKTIKIKGKPMSQTVIEMRSEERY